MADRRGVRAALPRPGAAAGRGKKRLTALAGWHFGGGAAYCRGCAAHKRQCAEGRLGAGGELCPYLAHEPATDAGWAAWDTLLRCAGQLRIAAGGIVIGLDLQAAIILGSHLGYGPIALAELLPAAEAGLIRALHDRFNHHS
ncbi:MAG: hypothetical protein AB7I59_02205 [Geminicoccaceae bacterium]